MLRIELELSIAACGFALKISAKPQAAMGLQGP